MLRAFVLTRTYQRACDVPSPSTLNFRDIAARQVELSTERQRMAAIVEPLAMAEQLSKAAYDEVLRRQENLLAKIPELLKKADEAKKKLDQAAAKALSAAAAANTLREQSTAVREAASKSADAASKLPDDQPLKEIVEKLEKRAVELATAYDAAAKKHADLSASQAAEEATYTTAQAAVSQAIGQQIKPEELRPLEQAYLSAVAGYEQAVYDLKAIEQSLAVCQMAADYAALRQSDPAKAESAWQSLVELWTQRNQIAALKPLTPEQLAFSAMRAAGGLDQQYQAVQAKLASAPPKELKNLTESGKETLMERLRQGMLIEQMRGTVSQFVGLYGGLPGEDFQATVNQALFFGNGSVVDNLIMPAKDNLTERLSKLEDADEIADELYLAILSRPASDEERTDIARMLSQSDDQRTQTICELSWSLLSSSEFRFNH